MTHKVADGEISGSTFASCSRICGAQPLRDEMIPTILTDFIEQIPRFRINFVSANVCRAQPLQSAKLHDITHDKIDLKLYAEARTAENLQPQALAMRRCSRNWRRWSMVDMYQHANLENLKFVDPHSADAEHSLCTASRCIDSGSTCTGFHDKICTL